MFVGHGLAAFAVVAALARRRGTDPERALVLGAVAGLFAAAPDVDIAYAFVGVVAGVGSGLGAVGLAETFWSTGNVVHRAVTHSLVVAPAVALAAAAWVDGRSVARATSLLAVVAVTGAAAAASGPLGGVVTLGFAAVALAAASVVRWRTDLTARTTFALALVGLASHPFGDVFTGEPPAFLYPLDVTLLASRVTLAADPTLHLLAAFAIELATVWAAAVVWSRLRAEREGRPHGRPVPPGRVDVRAVAGAGYAATAFLIPAPTLEVSYPFVFSVLAVGTIGLAPVRVRRPSRTALRTEFERPDAERALFTGLTAVTLAAAAYLLAYLSGVGVPA